MSEPNAPYALTEEEHQLLPTDAEVEFYAEHGWFLTKKLFSDDEIDRLVETTERFYAGERDRTLPLRPPRLAYWEPSHGPVQRHNDYIHYESDGVAAIICKPLVGAVAARLAQADAIRVFQSTLIYKPPRPEEPTNVVPWHFDKHYWATTTSEKMLTAFIPFHDCDEEMGTITMVDGSHLWKETGGDDNVTRHFAERDKEDLEALLRRNAEFNNATVNKIAMNIPKGHMSFHHCRTYHGSPGNRSPRPRRALSLHMQDGANEYRRFELTDGTVVAYNHDYLVRKTADGRPDYADPTYCPTIWAR
jgi:hypothetical protein